MTKTIKDPNQMIEAEIFKMLEILKNGSTNEQKRKARKELLRLEKHKIKIQDEYLNGKKYPVKEVPPKVSKKELLELIDSVPDGDEQSWDWSETEILSERIDLSGVSVGKNRFVYTD